MWQFPLNKKLLGSTENSDSFKLIDIATECEVPIRNHVGAFGAVRKHDIHKGIDLYANAGDAVYAVENGVVCLIRPFTGASIGTPWWNETEALNIAGPSGVVVYGEIKISNQLQMGSEVKRGDFLGTVQTVLQKDKGRPMSMLHLALHRHGIQSNGEWCLGAPQPKGLLNPTSYVLQGNDEDATLFTQVLESLPTM